MDFWGYSLLSFFFFKFFLVFCFIFFRLFSLHRKLSFFVLSFLFFLFSFLFFSFLFFSFLFFSFLFFSSLLFSSLLFSSLLISSHLISFLSFLPSFPSPFLLPIISPPPSPPHQKKTRTPQQKRLRLQKTFQSLHRLSGVVGYIVLVVVLCLGLRTTWGVEWGYKGGGIDVLTVFTGLCLFVISWWCGGVFSNVFFSVGVSGTVIYHLPSRRIGGKVNQE